MNRNSNIKTENEERVTSTYAEIYFTDDFCDYKFLEDSISDEILHEDTYKDEWISPSDLLIGKVELKPPFTSKITRGKTHKGILSIGDNVLESERAKFLKDLNGLINDNDNGWMHVLENEKELVVSKVKKIYDQIFIKKSEVMSKEINIFYESSLKELEKHVKSEIEVLLSSARAHIISDLNFEIRRKLAKERKILEDVLKKRYASEINKIKLYYKILVDSEMHSNNKLINQALFERNDALSAFCRQIETENLTTTMYIMCTERKKCRIKKLMLENYQTFELTEKVRKIKEKQKVLEDYKMKDVTLRQINKTWEENIKKVLQLFIKFISFSLKLLPDQTTFLLDLEKMVVLQINEIQKQPNKTASVLVDLSDFQNTFRFEEPLTEKPVCKNEPFTIVGDLSDPTPPKYGSRETLPSDVDLPYFRLQRKLVYAKCHGFEDIKTFLDTQRCQCQDIPSKPIFDAEITEVTNTKETPYIPETFSLDEPLLIDDIKRLHDCPARSCQDWIKKSKFPDMSTYLDFSDDNLDKVKTILGNKPTIKSTPETIDTKQYFEMELPFSATKEPYHTVETQCSSIDNLNSYISDVKCSCVNDDLVRVAESVVIMKETPSKDILEILNRRKTTLRNIIQDNPHLLKMFTDECFDFIL